MRKIIFINRFFYPDHSATSQLLSDLAFYLAKEGEEIEVICSRQAYDESGRPQKSSERINGVNITRIRSTNFGRFWLPGRVVDYVSYFIGMIYQLLVLVKRGDIVVVKTDPPLSSVLAWPIIKIKRGRQINWVQDLFPEVAIALRMKLLSGFVGRGLIWLRNFSFRHSYLTVVIGHIMKDKLVKQGVPSDKIRILTNWSDGQNIYPLEEKDNELREKWKLSGKFVVGYSGNMGRVHNFNEIIDAAITLKTHKDIAFVFIGNGPQKNKIQSRLDSLPNVFFFPYQDYGTLRFSLSLPDVHLISLKPSIEGYCVPSKFYGVLAAGKPVIFIGDLQSELAVELNQDSSGISIESNDSNGLVRAILSLRDNPEELSQKSKNARLSFEKKYDKPNLLADWRLILNQIG